MLKEQIQKLRINQLRKQGLLERTYEDFFVVLKTQLGFHSTDYWTPYLSAFARIGKFDARKVFDAFNSGDRLVRLHAFRRTVFAIHEDNVALILNALGPPFFEFIHKDTNVKKMLKGINSEKMVNELCKLLKGQTLKATDIKKQLSEIKDIFTPILRLAMAKGLVVRASATKARSSLTSYTLLSDWLPVNLQEMSQQEALEELLMKYIQINGPVSIDDAAWWLNITKSQTRKAFVNLSEELHEISIEDIQYYMQKEDYETAISFDSEYYPVVHFLPYEDHFPKAFVERSWYLGSEIKERIFPRTRQNYWPLQNNPIQTTGANTSGEIRPSIWLNDQVIGRWEFEGDIKQQKVVYELYRDVDEDLAEVIQKKCTGLENFVNQQLIPIS